jgi:hypothetical protein
LKLGRLFFIGGGVGGLIREEYDNYYNNNPSFLYINDAYRNDANPASGSRC